MNLIIKYEDGFSEAIANVKRAKTKGYKLFILFEDGEKETKEILSMDKSEVITAIYADEMMIFHLYELKWDLNLEALEKVDKESEKC